MTRPGDSTTRGPAATRIELVLVNGAVRAFDLPSATSSVANALARLDDWIETADGGWVHKSHIVEVREARRSAPAGTAAEYEALDAAAGTMAERHDD